MNVSPKTIQIFLPSGDPSGMRVAEVTTRTVQVLDIPRVLLPEFREMPESKQVALYMLVGENEDGTGQKVYIGYTGNIGKRLDEHNLQKGFWQRAIVLVSRTQSLTLTHAVFLEWQSIKLAKTAARYQVDENKKDGSKPHTPAPLLADCLEILDTGRTLFATLGYPVLEPVDNPQTADAEVFFCKRTGCDASGKYTTEGFVVLKGSSGRAAIANGFESQSFAKRRESLLEAGKLEIKDDALVFLEDVLFQSPSGASAVVCGSSSNGWVDWKNDKGETLDALKRGNTNNHGGSTE